MFGFQDVPVEIVILNFVSSEVVLTMCERGVDQDKNKNKNEFVQIFKHLLKILLK